MFDKYLVVPNRIRQVTYSRPQHRGSQKKERPGCCAQISELSPTCT